ncbi:MAG: GerMN domain-containing protein [Armatimonadetes bacterium]|nr:GerMN domain-containing protein [Armatimonadota bacterium]MDW8029155.1 GerMN domain-containing protein [Armatimonadota bacterium]
MKQGLWILVIAVLVVVVALILGIWSIRTPIKVEKTKPSIVKQWQVTLCYPDLKASKLVKFTMSVGAASEERIANEIFERLKSPEGGELSPAIPKGAKLISVKREGDVLVLDVSSEFTEPQFWQGTDVAHLRLQAIVHSLTSLPNTRAIKILVDGQVPEALGGHEELSEPVEPDPTL